MASYTRPDRTLDRPPVDRWLQSLMRVDRVLVTDLLTAGVS